MAYSDEKDFTKFKKVDVSSWNNLKNNVFIRLVNAKHIPKYNKDIYGGEVAFFKWIDLAATFSVQETIREKDGKVLLSHMLTTQELEQYGVTVEDVKVQALKNMMHSRQRRILQFRYFTVQDSMMYPVLEMPNGMKMQVGSKNEPSGFINDVDYDFESKEETENILVITNRDDCLGSSFICVPSMLEEVYERFGENFYIVPMSVHQTMCIRNGYASHRGKKPRYEVEDDLIDMVEGFNDKPDTPWKDILTYKIYYYMGDDGHLVIPINP